MVKLSRLARGEILVFTDANTQFRANTVRALVEPFADPAVGCVDGSKQNSLNNITCESVYWRYEQMLKALGSRLGAVLGATGAVFAVRKSLYTPGDPSRADDFETAVTTRIKGHLCVYNSEAVAAEPTPRQLQPVSPSGPNSELDDGLRLHPSLESLKAGRVGLVLQLLIHRC